MENAKADRTIVCKSCGAEFVFTVGEQEFYEANHLKNEPKTCKPCRDAKKQRRYTGVCAECGGEAQVVFKPREDAPVWCDECFAVRKENGLS